MSDVWHWQGPDGDDAGERRWRRKETWPTQAKQRKRKVKTLKSGDAVSKDAKTGKVLSGVANRARKREAYLKLKDAGRSTGKRKRSRERVAGRKRANKQAAHDRHYSNVKHQRLEVMRNKDRATYGGTAYNRDGSIARPAREAGVVRANRALGRYRNFDEVDEIPGLRQTEFGKAFHSGKAFADLVKVYGQVKAERLMNALVRRSEQRYVAKASLGLPPGAAPAAPGAAPGAAAAGGAAPAGPQPPKAPSANQAAPSKPKKTLKPKAK